MYKKGVLFYTNLTKEKTGSNQGFLSPIYAPSNVSIAQFKKIFNNNFVEFKNEKQLIKEQAFANGTFLKAPNGKQSNLSEDLWLNVRRDSFKNWFGDWENEPQNASKVVDENGEPLVVYHGTPLSRKQKTKNTGWYTDENGKEQYRRQEAPFSIFRGGAYNGLIFFSADKTKAKEIANYRSMHIPDDKNGNEQWTEEGYVYDVFINAKNPFNVANKKNINKILDSIDNIEAYDFYTNKLTKITKNEAIEILSGNNSWMVAETKQFLDAIKAYGYDALQAKDEGVEYTAVFEPTQIKSVNNRGSFDSKNPDIFLQASSVRNNFGKMVDKLINFAQDIVGKKTNDTGIVLNNIEVIKRVSDEVKKKLGKNIKDYKHVVSRDGIQHFYNNHAKKQNIPLEEIGVVPYILLNPDSIEVKKTGITKPNKIVYKKKMGKDAYIYVEEILNEREKTLTTKTFYIEGDINLDGAKNAGYQPFSVRHHPTPFDSLTQDNLFVNVKFV